MNIALLEKNLSERICAEPMSGCWLWEGNIGPGGYGRVIRATGKYMLAHRAAYMVWRGSITRGLDVCHKCDVRSCVNPAHLFLGTPFDNARDMVRKGRSLRGERNNRSKLTQEQAMSIRKSIARSAEVAKKFGVSIATVQHIRRGHTWRHMGQS